MALELCYTSAPKGLAPGSRGFCTVAATRGMPSPLVERLESLSGYRALQGNGNGHADTHPVNWSHREITLGGQTYSILSRIGFAGADYTGRSNKFAHHVALREDERPPAGPAWVMRQPGFMRDAWAGEPALIGDEKAAPWGEAEPAVCEAWKRAAGDAGWAGVLAESFVLDRSKPAYVIYRPGQVDPLALVAEAIALLPVSLRWQVHFSTYFTDLPAGLACHWRFVVAGTPAAEQAKQAKGDLLRIDLQAPAGRFRESRYTVAARTGEAAPAEERVAIAVSNGAKHATRKPVKEEDGDEGYDLAVMDPPRVTAPKGKPAPSRKPVAAAVARETPRRRVPAWLAALAASLATAGAAWLWILAGGVGAAEPGPAAAEIAALREQLGASQSRVAELERQLAEAQHRLATSAVATPAPVPAAPESVVPDPEPLAAPVVITPPAPQPPAAAPAAAPGVTAVGETRAVAAMADRFAASWPERRSDGGEIGNASADAALRPLLSGFDGGESVRVMSPVDEASGRPWRFVEARGGVELVYEEADALGVVKPRVVSEAGIAEGVLAWRWRPSAAPIEARRAGVADRLMQYALLKAVDSGGGVRAEVQFVAPQRAELKLGGQPVPLEHAWSDASPELVVLGEPAGWRIAERTPAQVTLTTPSGGSISVALRIGGEEHPAAVSATWGKDSEPAQLKDNIAALRAQLDDDRVLVKEYRELRSAVEAAARPLPRQKGQVDENAASREPHRAAFQAYQRAQDRLRDFEAEHDGVDLKDLSARAAAAERDLPRLEARLSQVQRLERVQCLVVAARSKALLAEVEVSP